MKSNILPDYPKPSNKKALVVFSGGIDSTMALIWAHINYENVRCISVDSNGLPSSTAQSKARKDIVELINSRSALSLGAVSAFNDVKMSEVSFNFTTGHFGINYAERDFASQPMLWASVMPMFLMSDEDLVFGYIKGDDFWEWRQDALQIMKSIIAFKSLKNTNIVFPLEKQSKFEIIRFLTHFNSQILEKCIYCEDARLIEGKWLNCGICPKCKKVHKEAGVFAKTLQDNCRFKEEITASQQNDTETAQSA